MKTIVWWLAILSASMLPVAVAAPMPSGMGVEEQKNYTDIATSMFYNISLLYPQTSILNVQSNMFGGSLVFTVTTDKSTAANVYQVVQDGALVYLDFYAIYGLPDEAIISVVNPAQKLIGSGYADSQWVRAMPNPRFPNGADLDIYLRKVVGATTIFTWNLSESSASANLPASAFAGFHPTPQMSYIAPNTSQSPDWLTPTPLALGSDRFPGGIMGGQITDSSGRILDANSVADALVNGQLQENPGVVYTAADQQNDTIFMAWYNALLKVGGQDVIDRAVKRRNSRAV